MKAANKINTLYPNPLLLTDFVLKGFVLKLNVRLVFVSFHINLSPGDLLLSSVL